MKTKELEFKTEINAPSKKVWEIMIDPETYKQWTHVSWPDSFYKGEWAKGSDIAFIGPDSSGTLATLTEFEPYHAIVAKHVAILLSGGKEDRTSEDAKKWIGTTESYYFDEKNGKTNLTIKMKVTPEWEQMFNDGWPKALEKLKEISEQ